MVAIARHLMIHGRVQGVWYRAWMVETARSMGLTGWVRNRLDGCVEAFVQGDAATVEALTGLAQQGPPAAVVARIDQSEALQEAMTTFEKRLTA